MRRVIGLTLTGLLLASGVWAQETVTVKLTAKQAHAVRVVRGADVNLTALVQSWLDNWLVQFETDAVEMDRKRLREAIEKASPEVEAQVRKILNAPAPAPVTAEERAARLKAEQEAAAAAKAATEAETKRIAAEKAAAVKAAQDAGAAQLKAQQDAAAQAAKERLAALLKACQDKVAALKLTTLKCEEIIR